MAMVPEITPDDHERVRLNSARYAGGIAATLLVLGIAWIAFQMYGVSRNAFHILAISSIGKRSLSFPELSNLIYRSISIYLSFYSNWRFLYSCISDWSERGGCFR